MTEYTIRQVADKTGLSMHTIRWYERIGLLDEIERSTDGRRRFGDRDLDWLDLLVKLRATGMPVAQMQRYTELVRAGAATEPERLRLLAAHRERVLADLATQRECLALLDYKIMTYGGTPRERHRPKEDQ